MSVRTFVQESKYESKWVDLPPLPPLLIAWPAAVALPEIDPGVGDEPLDAGLLTFRS